METRTIETQTHGRYLVRTPRGNGPWPVLMGFHGYRENAAVHLTMLERIPGNEGWLLVAVQALHRFYTKGGDVVASWMTREDRELAIADNIAYVGRIVTAVREEFATNDVLAFAGFSQGTAMAFRAAAHFASRGLVVAGADVPPDVIARTPVRLPPVLYGRGVRDELYTADFHQRDVSALERLGTLVESITYEGGHEVTTDFVAAAGRLLHRISSGL